MAHTAWDRAAAAWLQPWHILDLVAWACVVAWAFLDLLTTAAALSTGSAAEGNAVGAHAWDAGGAVALLQLKVAALLAVTILWALAPRPWRPWVRAGTVAGGGVTLLAAAHNAWLLLAVLRAG